MKIKSHWRDKSAAAIIDDLISLQQMKNENLLEAIKGELSENVKNYKIKLVKLY